MNQTSNAPITDPLLAVRLARILVGAFIAETLVMAALVMAWPLLMGMPFKGFVPELPLPSLPLVLALGLPPAVGAVWLWRRLLPPGLDPFNNRQVEPARLQRYQQAHVLAATLANLGPTLGFVGFLLDANALGFWVTATAGLLALTRIFPRRGPRVI